MRRAVSFLTPFGRVGDAHRAPRWRGFPSSERSSVLRVGGVWWLAAKVWFRLIAGAIAVVADLALTGLLHFDGLADAGDGLLAPLTRERRLAAMADPAIGAFGALTVGAVLLLRFGAFASLRPVAARRSRDSGARRAPRWSRSPKRFPTLGPTDSCRAFSALAPRRQRGVLQSIRRRRHCAVGRPGRARPRTCADSPRSGQNSSPSLSSRSSRVGASAATPATCSAPRASSARPSDSWHWRCDEDDPSSGPLGPSPRRRASCSIDSSASPRSSWHPVVHFGRAMDAFEASHLPRREGPRGAPRARGHAARRRAPVALMRSTSWRDRPRRRRALALARCRRCRRARSLAGDLDGARALLPNLVGRDPSDLDEEEIVRAVVESVAENTVDAIVAPAAVGGRRGCARRTRLSRGQHDGRNGRSSFGSLRALRLGERSTRRRCELGAGPCGRCARRGRSTERGARHPPRRVNAVIRAPLTERWRGRGRIRRRARGATRRPQPLRRSGRGAPDTRRWSTGPRRGHQRSDPPQSRCRDVARVDPRLHRPRAVVAAPMTVPRAGAHGGDAERVARALGLDPASMLDLSQSLNPVGSRSATRDCGAPRCTHALPRSHGGAPRTRGRHERSTPIASC